MNTYEGSQRSESPLFADVIFGNTYAKLGSPEIDSLVLEGFVELGQQEDRRHG